MGSSFSAGAATAPNPEGGTVAPPAFGEAPACPPFANGPEAHIFRFRYDGPARGLNSYLLERYAYGRDAGWARSFYPGRVRLNDAPVDAATRVMPGDRISYLHLRAEEPAPAAPMRVLHEDPHLLALLKDDHTPVNPSGVYYFTSLAIRAREWAGDEALTPLHRLDLETSGPVLFARSREEIAAWHRLFQEKTLRKRYRALVHGHYPERLTEIAGWIVPDPGSPIRTRLRLLPGGEGSEPPAEAGAQEPSLTRVRVLRRLRLAEPSAEHGAELTELEVEPVTGKTNQIRVALAHAGHPIVGDKKYHPDPAVFLDWIAHRDFERLRPRLLLPRQALHCESLDFEHPFTGTTVKVRAPDSDWPAKLAALPPSCEVRPGG